MKDRESDFIFGVFRRCCLEERQYFADHSNKMLTREREIERELWRDIALIVGIKEPKIFLSV
jgi:hypothetical protein